MGNVYLREANIDDMMLLFDWANEPAVRLNSFNSQPIQLETHKQWFNNVLTDTSIKQYIMMDDSNPVGQVRLKFLEGTPEVVGIKQKAEISYSISSNYRGLGYGAKIIGLLLELLKDNVGLVFVAKVKESNLASKKIFEKLGFSKSETMVKDSDGSEYWAYEYRI